MSKIGVKPILIPDSVTVKTEPGLLSVKGPKGELLLKIKPGIKVTLQEKDQKKEIKISRENDSLMAKSLHGLVRTLIANMILGVTEGFSKNLKIVGTGYRAALESKDLILNVGFSHPVKIKPLEGIEFEIKNNNEIIVKGSDKQLVGQVAADIREIKPPEVYKGKGIRYKNELVRKKPGKAAKTIVAA